jgi:methyl-accepting chemotaxis protein
MDELTRQNAARVAQAADASTALQTQAAELLQAVGVFRLRDEPSPPIQAAPRVTHQGLAASAALAGG